MSFSLLRGLVIDHLRARLLCGHTEYLTSRLCQPMWIPVIFLFSLFFEASSQCPKVVHPSVACPVCSYPISDFASNVAM